ncbi:MAG: aminopeptidase [Candidatus Woesearchaeota archaeon]
MDQRIEKLADILVNHSIKVKKGEKVAIEGQTQAKELMLAVYVKVLEAGGFPYINADFSETRYLLLKTASDEQLDHFPEHDEFNSRYFDSFIKIGAPENTRQLSSIDSGKIAKRMAITRKISNYIVDNKKWVITMFPTNAQAVEADMSLEEYEDFVYSSTNIDWSEQSRYQDKIKDLFDNHDIVEIKDNDTDLRFSIKDRTGNKCDGGFNMPDGEVFYAPVKDTVEGHIRFTYPGIRDGKEITNIYLEFEKGRVVKATADKNEELLKKLIETDEGSHYIGEFGIGTNFGIKRYVKNLLFDEKIGGTIHLALGKAYKEGGGKNESALHYDIVKDLRNSGEIIVDGKTVQKNGKWVFE